MKYVILPMQPTPNGRMHIGHGGGTYLRADVLARALRSSGHDVSVACGTDAYENWVLAASQLDGRSPEETCASYDAGIRADLAALDIHFDAWIDPLSEEHRDSYVRMHNDAFEEVRELRGAAAEPERIPVDGSGAPLMGTFIAGKCPHCGEHAGGSSCTACGQHFQPEELVDAFARMTGETVAWREEQSWFLTPLDPGAITERLADDGLADRHLSVVREYLHASGGRVRVSGPGVWGVPSPALPPRHVLSNSYYLYCAYACQVVTDAPRPLTQDSPVQTVGVFGSDNSVPGMVVPQVYSQVTGGRRRAFDHVVVNGMLDLDGRKCSTSKRYGIWLKDILRPGLVTSDELRYALAGTDLDSGRANLDLTAFVHEINEFRRAVREHVLPALNSDWVAAATRVDSATVGQAYQWLRPESFRLADARQVLSRHLHSANAGTPEWLATLAALAEPITPRLSQAIHRAVGGGASDVDEVSGTGELLLAEVESVVCRGIETRVAESHVQNGVQK